ncbi:MAG: hypothetical protein ABI091_17550, partial [Ferruginibacter sp.]
MDFTAEEFFKVQESYDRISFLEPYYKSNPEIRSVIELKSPYEKLKLLSSIYPFNSSIFTIAVGNTEFNKKRKEDFKGYVPLNGKWNQPIETSSLGKYDIDSEKVKLYKSFIEDCISSKIGLYIICSPYFLKYNPPDYSIKIGKEIATKYNILFFDYSTDSTFINNPKLFNNIAHLNDDGAKIFS